MWPCSRPRRSPSPRRHKIADTKRIATLAAQVIDDAAELGVKVATAESCTGGMIGAALTDIAGASCVFDRGFITYSYEAKNETLGVSMRLIENHGAVSAEVARAMVLGALERSHADIVISVTGIAGPGGGMPDKPVGLVWFGLAARNGRVRTVRRIFAGGSRRYVRIKTVETALLLLLHRLHNRP